MHLNHDQTCHLYHLTLSHLYNFQTLFQLCTFHSPSPYFSTRRPFHSWAVFVKLNRFQSTLYEGNRSFVWNPFLLWNKLFFNNFVPGRFAVRQEPLREPARRVDSRRQNRPIGGCSAFELTRKFCAQARQDLENIHQQHSSSKSLELFGKPKSNLTSASLHRIPNDLTVLDDFERSLRAFLLKINLSTHPGGYF